jgi:Tfp pilus assembly protein FimT
MRSISVRRAGHTLVELAAALAVAAVLVALALPTGRRALDSAAVRAARDETAAFLEDARRRAQWRGERVEVRIDTAAGALLMLATSGDTVERRAIRAVHGVSLAADRASIAWAPTGLGYGAANARLVLTRGASEDTLWLSRLGRVRQR